MVDLKEKSKKYSVYCIQNNKNLKMYIGWSSNVEKRWASERKFAFQKNKRDHRSILSNAFRSCGAKNAKEVKRYFTFIVLEEFDNLEDSLEAEKFWIEFFRTNVRKYGDDAGYNILEGGGCGILGYKFTDEQKQKLSDLSLKGENNPSSKLKQQDVDNIRKEYAAGSMSLGKLSIKYDLSKSNISMIIKNQSWFDNEYIPDLEKIKLFSKLNNSKYKLNYELAEQIRIDFKQIECDYGAKVKLAKKYNLTDTMIGNIVKNKCWVKK